MKSKVKITTKKLIAVLLTLLIISSVLPSFTVSTSAESTNNFSLSAVIGYPNGYNGEGYTNLFDGDTGTKWCCDFSDSAHVIFKASEPVKVSKYSIATANDAVSNPGRNPVKWTLSACMNYTDETTSWTVIDTEDGGLPNKDKTYAYFDLAETTPFYQYFKLEITNINDGNILQISEIALEEYKLGEHQWEDTGETIAPTCTEGGYYVEYCPLCQGTRNVPINALGHNFVDGVCTRCDADESAPYQPIKDINGIYQIGTAQELYWFAGLVNGTLTGITQNTSAKAVLTADIIVNKDVLKADGTLNSGTFTDWTPIGNYSNQYTGKFDGQGHTISGLYFNNSSTSYVGLFGRIGSGGEIKNVGVIDSYFKDYSYVGGVCGMNDGTITGCYNTGTVSGSDGAFYVGGVCGFNYSGTITGSYNTGTVSGDSSVGGVCGYNYKGIITGCYNTGTVSDSGRSVGGVCGYNSGGKITGCYNIGTVSGDSYVGGVCGFNDSGTITGCYTNNKDICGLNNGTVTNCDVKTDAEFKDTTVCKLLNTALQNANSDVHFYQGVNYPVLIIIPNLPKLVDDVYQISNEKELYAFAKLVNSYAEPSANAVLTADITVNNNLLSSLEFDEIGNVTNKDSFESWDPIGNGIDSYTGKFDGQGHAISGLYRDSNEIGAGLFKKLGSGGEIKNVGVIDSYFKGDLGIGGVCGINNGTITGCYNTGKVSGYDFVGGVCGMNEGGTITGCYNTGTVSGDSSVGGVCGYNSGGKITGCYTNNGGVCGDNKGTIIGCYTNSGGGLYEEFKNGTVCKDLNTALKNANSKVLFCQRIGTDVLPLLDYQVEEHTAIYTVENNTFKLACLCGKKDTKTMELTLITQKTVVASGADNTLTATLSNLDNEVVTYKWYQNGIEIEGATSSTYKMPTNLSVGTYTYRVDVTMEGVGTISQTVDVIVDITPQYYVEIPATNVNVGGSFTVSASNVLLKNNAQLKVSLESDFVLSNENGTLLKYEILTDNGKINSGDTLLTVTGSENPTAPGSGTSETYNVALAQGEKAKYSGNYTDTLTFTIKVEP